MLNRLIFMSAVAVVVLLSVHASAIAQSSVDENPPKLAGWADSDNHISANTPTPPVLPEAQTETPSRPTAPDVARLQNLGQKLAAEKPVTPILPVAKTIEQTNAVVEQSSPTAATIEQPKPLEIDSKLILQPCDSEGIDPGTPKTTTNEGQSYWLNTITALGIVIAIIFLLKKIVARMSGTISAKTSNSIVELLSRTSVAPRNHVLVLRVGQRVLIVSDSSQGLRTLSEITNPEEIAHILANVSAGKPNSVSRSFNQLFKRYDGDYDQNQWAEEGADQSEYSVDRARDSVSSLLSKVKSMSSRGGSS